MDIPPSTKYLHFNLFLIFYKVEKSKNNNILCEVK